MRNINQKGIDLIKQFEGCKLTAYYDIGGILTIGFGYIGPNIHPGMVVTQEEADSMLMDRLEAFQNDLNDIVPDTITGNQFSALMSFVYNLGVKSLRTSTLLVKLKQGDVQGAADQFLRWDRDNGNVVQGLLNRREAEKALFLTPDQG